MPVATTHSLKSFYHLPIKENYKQCFPKAQLSGNFPNSFLDFETIKLTGKFSQRIFSETVESKVAGLVPITFCI